MDVDVRDPLCLHTQVCISSDLVFYINSRPTQEQLFTTECVCVPKAGSASNDFRLQELIMNQSIKK